MDRQALPAFTPEMLADPYPVYRELRESDPVAFWDDLGVWLITRYADAVAILRDHRFSVDHTRAESREGAPRVADNVGPTDRGMQNVLLFIDPPDHTRIRGLVNKAFTPRVVESLRPRIEAVADELIDSVADKGEMDVIADLAYPLPVRVISEMLGVPADDRDRIRAWSRDIAPILDPVLPWDTAARVGNASVGLAAFFEDLINERRRDLGDDLVSHLIRAEEEGEKLSQDELRATCILLLIAGHETTMNLIGNGTYALLRNRDQLERLRDDPSLIHTGVEELLRFDSPVHLTGRTAVEDVEIAGKTIAANQMAVVLIAAANRDPAQFPDPERLEVARHPNKHIAFSAGHHFCLGATLARVEGQVVLARILERLPKLDLAVERCDYRDTITLRGLKELPVTF